MYELEEFSFRQYIDHKNIFLPKYKGILITLENNKKNNVLN